MHRMESAAQHVPTSLQLGVAALALALMKRTEACWNLPSECNVWPTVISTCDATRESVCGYVSIISVNWQHTSKATVYLHDVNATATMDSKHITRKIKYGWQSFATRSCISSSHVTHNRSSSSDSPISVLGALPPCGSTPSVNNSPSIISLASVRSLNASPSFPAGRHTSAIRILHNAKAAGSGSQVYAASLDCSTSRINPRSFCLSFVALKASPSNNLANVRMTA
mmetsp:Transcript_6438/g.23314  ORF Transcript_6438/g.23314 Transcript_6438/m.23314 type:complete len:226 (+) Transcript_6438:1246-1923(+)